MTPLFTVTNIKDKNYNVFLDGRIEGCPEDATIIFSHAYSLVNLLLGLAEEAIDNGVSSVSRKDFTDFISQWGLA